MKSIIQLSFLLLFLISSSVVFAQKQKIIGSGKVITENRSVGSFDGIDVAGAWQVTLKKGNEGDLKITTDDNYMPHVVTEVVNGMLKIYTRNGWVKNVNEMKIEIQYKDINEIDISGACNMKVEGTLNASDFDLDASGASNIILKVEANEFEGDCSGASNIEISGRASKAKLDMSGATSFKGFDFDIQNAEVDASGAASVKLSVSSSLDVKCFGAASVKYKGSPTVNQKVSGAGSVRAASF